MAEDVNIANVWHELVAEAKSEERALEVFEEMAASAKVVAYDWMFDDVPAVKAAVFDHKKDGVIFCFIDKSMLRFGFNGDGLCVALMDNEELVRLLGNYVMAYWAEKEKNEVRIDSG